jgi:hypothetical protein
MKLVRIYVVAVMLSGSPFLLAQRVLYSPFIDERYSSHIEIAGKTADYYWLLKEKKQSSKRQIVLQQGFEVYDSRLTL